VYNLQYSKDPLQHEQALSTILNNANLDKLDNNMLLIRSNTAELRETQAREQSYKVLLVGIGGDRLS
jgi:hypothetical protein